MSETRRPEARPETRQRPEREDPSTRPEDGFAYGPYLYRRGRWWIVSDQHMKVAVDGSTGMILNELYRAVDVIYSLAAVECVHCQAARDAGEKPNLAHHDEPQAVAATRGFLESRLTG